jgi:hypothetical protein
MSNPYRRLETIFNKFNTALVEFFGDLLDLAKTDSQHKLIINAFNDTLNDTSNFYRILSKILFLGK